MSSSTPIAETVTTPLQPDQGEALPESPPSPALARNASIVAGAFVVSRILGLAREIVLANRFGTSSDYDAYLSAFRIPDLLFLVIMSGAFGSAFVPVFSGYLVRDRRDLANRLASGVVTYTMILTALLGTVAFIFADPIMRYIVAPDLPAESMELAISTMRWLLLSPILLGMGIAAKGILEAQQKFFLPAMAPVVYNLSILLAAIFLAPTYGINGVTAGVLLGALLHVGIQVPGVIRSGTVIRPVLRERVEGLGEVGRLLLPRVIGQAAFQINFVAVNHFASTAGEGRVSGMNYAWMMMMLPNGVIALSISTVIFPSMAEAFERGNVDAVKSLLGRAMRPLLFLIIPSSIILYAFGTAMFQSVFQTGSFTAESTRLAANPLALLAGGLVFYGLVEVLARTFYAMRDTITPVAAGLFIIALNIVLCYLTVDRLGHVGLAMSLTISTMVEAVILSFVLRRRLGGFGQQFGGWIVRVILAAVAMAAVAEAIRPQLDHVTDPENTNRLVALGMLGFGFVLVGSTYLAVCYLLGVPEISRLTTPLKRFRRRPPTVEGM